MGINSATETVIVNGSAEDVLAFVRDVGNQSTWWPGMFKSDVLETDDEGRCVKAAIGNDVKIAKDEFQVAYVHGDDGYTWSLASPSKVQKVQNGAWTVAPKGADQCTATLRLDIDASLPLPGFVIKKTTNDAVKNAVKALQKQFG
jgi:ribosome-associated toxin RatA of RatAB toxin-antitoxin module